MHHRTLVPALALAAALLPASRTAAQDFVTLHSVTIGAANDVTVVYSKNFATCAHLRFSDATCQVNGPLTHVQNHFCTSGNNVSVTVPLAAFNAGFGPHVPVFMVHGNNGGVRSACVDVGSNGAFGSGCAGVAGVPLLDAVDDCPPAGTSLDARITGSAPGSLAVLGFGAGQGSLPLLGCNLLLGSVLATTVVVLDGSGAGTFSLPLPAGSTGFQLTMQAFVLDAAGPQGFAATNGLLVRVS
jgi:hypothetical protein